MYLVRAQDFDEFKEWYQGREAREEAKKKAAEEAAAEAEANKLKKLGSVTRPKERTGEVNVDDPAFEEKLQQIFDRYDDDGSGEIDAVRSPSPRRQAWPLDSEVWCCWIVYGPLFAAGGARSDIRGVRAADGAGRADSLGRRDRC
eukprot:COSAG04_NODE_2279_length_4398_cov_2.596650_3_plen_145_part_00